MTSPDFRLPKIGREFKNLKDDSFYGATGKSLETKDNTNFNKIGKYQNILKSILVPENETPEAQNSPLSLNVTLNLDQRRESRLNDTTLVQNRILQTHAGDAQNYITRPVMPKKISDMRKRSVDVRSSLQVSHLRTMDAQRDSTPLHITNNRSAETPSPMMRSNQPMIRPIIPSRLETTIDGSTDIGGSSGMAQSTIQDQFRSRGINLYLEKQAKVRNTPNGRMRNNMLSTSLEVQKINQTMDQSFNTPSRPATKLPGTTNFRPLHRGTENLKPKINLELIAALHTEIKSMMEKSQTPREAVKHAKTYLQLIDKEEFYNLDLVFLDPKVRKNFKVFLLLERITVLLVLLLAEENSKQDRPVQFLPELLETAYINFLYFLDMILQRTSSIFKQNTWVEQLCSIRSDAKYGTGSVGMHNEKIIRMLKSPKLKANCAFLEKFPLVLETLANASLKESYSNIKQLFAPTITKWKVDILTGTPTIKSEAVQNSSGKSEVGPHTKPIDRPEPPQRCEDSPQLNTKSELRSTLAKSIKSPLKEIKPDYNKQPTQKPKQVRFLPPLDKERGENGTPVYSLVLDLDETLIHYEESFGRGKFFVRPYADLFLREMSEYYELIIFTAATQDYADIVLDILDKRKYIKHRLYRQHTTPATTDTGVLKDLSKIGRDLSKTLLVDNVPENFALQPDNGIEIKSWFSDPYDRELLDMIPLLKSIVSDGSEDVRKSIRKWREGLKKN